MPQIHLERITRTFERSKDHLEGERDKVCVFVHVCTRVYMCVVMVRNATTHVGRERGVVVVRYTTSQCEDTQEHHRRGTLILPSSSHQTNKDTQEHHRRRDTVRALHHA